RALTNSSSVRTGCGRVGLDGVNACRIFISPVPLRRPSQFRTDLFVCDEQTAVSLAQADDLYCSAIHRAVRLAAAAREAQDLIVTRDRDVQAFYHRSPDYETGFRGQLHAEIVTRSLDLALAHCPSPDRVLDVGCGTGLLLRDLARRLPGAASLAGIDAAAGMIEQARAKGSDPRLRFEQGTAERLPF